MFVYPCADGHVTCLECFCDYAVSRLRERQFVFDEILGYTLPCPAGCLNSLIHQPYHFKALTKDHVSKIECTEIYTLNLFCIFINFFNSTLPFKFTIDVSFFVYNVFFNNYLLLFVQ